MDSLNSLLDFTKICRLCLSQDRTLSHIFSNYNTNSEILASSLASTILACVSIEVEFEDNLPDKVCDRCTEQLDNWVKFKELCDNANSLLLQCAAGITPISDEVLQKNLQGCSSEHIPQTPSDFRFEEVNFIEHDSLFIKFDDSKEGLPKFDDPAEELPKFDESKGLPSNESFVNESLSVILSENIENLQSAIVNEIEQNKKEEKEAKKELEKSKWREKYSRIYSKKYNCGICPRFFSKFTSLLQHDHVDHSEVGLSEFCGKCNKRFISKERLEIHELMKHKDKIFECDICGLQSSSEKSLKTHKLRHSNRFVCKVCGTTTSSESLLQDHLRVHSDERSFSCEVCRQSYKHRQALKNHLKSHNPQCALFICGVCSRTFKTVEYLKKHKSTHMTEKISICETCGEVLKNERTLYIHRLTHSEKQHICVVCDKMFLTKNLLTRHTLVHGARPYVCPVCNKSFNRADTLSLHKKTHENSRTFACDYCEQTFTMNRYLKRHIFRIHNKEDSI